jgi:glucose-6-phosphate 1-dehydrogenase
MRNPTLQDVVLGQYKASIAKDGRSKVPGYLEEQDVHPESRTPTFVAAVLYIDNSRWDGVPFLIKAGMGLIKNRYILSILPLLLG